MINQKTFKSLPGIMSFQRGLVISDATFSNETSKGLTPVNVIRTGIRGTQNINKENGNDNHALTANAKRREVSNVQRTDFAKLDPKASALIVEFSIRFLDLGKALYACAPGAQDDLQEFTDIKSSVFEFIDRAKSASGIDEISLRYARNIMNGRWLWRNRLIAQQIEITAKNSNGAEIGVSDALAIPLNNFSNFTDSEVALSKIIAEGIRGKSLQEIKVSARLVLGVSGSVEVFPSQNYLDQKSKGFARSLYKLGHPEKKVKDSDIRVMGQAAIRDQKLSNAIRTIDTWYPDFEIFQKPLAVEPNGANLDAQMFFRDTKTSSAFSLMCKLNTLSPDSSDGMFVTASLIRGGVFSRAKK